MKCPFELPVKAIYLYTGAFGPQYRFDDSEGNELLSISISKEQADYIVQAINCHEKFKIASAKAYEGLCINDPDACDEAIKLLDELTKITERP